MRECANPTIKLAPAGIATIAREALAGREATAEQLAPATVDIREVLMKALTSGQAKVVLAPPPPATITTTITPSGDLQK